jgi:hypothetical protein
MTTRREITPEELEAVFGLAAIYPDLRVIAAELKDLRARVPALSLAALGGASDEVKPRSVSDLLRLQKAGIIDESAVRERLGIKPKVGTAGPVAKGGRFMEWLRSLPMAQPVVGRS